MGAGQQIRQFGILFGYKTDLDIEEFSVRLTTEEIDLIVRALGRVASRYDSEARYAKDGRGANNYKNAKRRADLSRDLRDRIAQSIGLEIRETK